MRINNADDTEDWQDDLAAMGGAPGLLGIVLAKAENASHVEATAARLPAGTPIVAMIESHRVWTTAWPSPLRTPRCGWRSG
ncbi:hypothetical protein [Rhodococcus koreensis]|uniref:hypothetical protein n=1 Tax=Rhodococcus koreensis TaxID=99653 RepID=UPI00366C9D5F